MLYLNDPLGAKQAMFKEAAAVGASTIRLDIALSGVFADPDGPPDWSGVDQYMSLARRYHLRVLADLLATPWYAVDCPPGTPAGVSYRCPPSNPALWGEQAGMIAAHTRGVIDDFEIINEPDGGWAFLGTPQQYARVLSASYHAIHAANPSAKVALGGLMNIGPGGQAWMNEVLTALGADATDKFDIANIHVRTPAADVGAVVSDWRHYFARKGFRGPLWVTETGYPADPAWQTDPGYTNGPTAQARWLTTVIPAMLQAGAAMAFVTERDSLGGPFASEGILDSTDPLTANPQYTRRPSFYAVRDLATVTFGPQPTTTVLGSPYAKSATLTLRIACHGNRGQICSGIAKITTRTTIRASANWHSRGLSTCHPRVRCNTTTIARATFSVRAANTIRLTVNLGPAGRKLLATVRRIPATLKIATTHNHLVTTLRSIKITFRA